MVHWAPLTFQRQNKARQNITDESWVCCVKQQQRCDTPKMREQNLCQFFFFSKTLWWEHSSIQNCGFVRDIYHCNQVVFQKSCVWPNDSCSCQKVNCLKECFVSEVNLLVVLSTKSTIWLMSNSFSERFQLCPIKFSPPELIERRHCNPLICMSNQ